MSTVDWKIPPSTLHWLSAIPADRPVCMLVRHSVREALPAGHAGYILPITQVGKQLAAQLGQHLAARLRSAHSSPLVRTVQTAEQLARGSGLQAQVQRDTLLGDPGAFVVDSRAGDSWERLGHEEMMRRLVMPDGPPPPGCADPEPAARFLVHHMLAAAGEDVGIHAFCTHDSLVTATVAHMLGRHMMPSDWPWYLEAAFFWPDDDGAVHAAYRNWHARRAAPLVELSESDVLGLARRELAATVGLECTARYFLAGGVFKTLLTGRAPRDLDLWAASAADRAQLCQTLIDRGAERGPDQPYTDAFHLAGRVIEVSQKVVPSTLEQRLARFDIGLSAVGVEHQGQDKWRAHIHPRALESVRKRQVLLLDDLPNWRHSLASLVRLQQYGRELGFAVPESETRRIWDIFEQQSPEKRAGMVERFKSSRHCTAEILEEAACRA